MKNIICIFFVSFIIYSCKNKEYSGEKESLYNDFLNSTEIETHNVFELDENLDVESSDFTSIVFPNSIIVFNYSVYMVGKSYDTNEFKHILTKIISKSIFDFEYKNINESDTGVNTFFDNKQHLYFPYFRQQYQTINNFIDIKNAKIYLFNHKTGYFLIDKKYFISENNIIKKQKKFKNGFCNGVIVDNDNKKIIYFDLIW